MVKHSLTVALVKSALQVLHRMGPTGRSHHRRRLRCRGRRGRRHHQTVPGGTLDLDRLHRTGGDLVAGPSRQAPELIPNPRVRVLQRPPSPSPTPSTYFPMEPSYPTTSLRGHREPPCAIHGMSSGPYPVAPRKTVLSSPSPREGEEGVADVEDMVEVVVAEEDDVVEVAVAEEEDDGKLVKVIPVPDSPPP
jgi:hypothetical protein